MAREVADLGERQLVERILARIGTPPGALVAGGDDTALIPVETDRLLVTTDELVESVDFDFSYCSGGDVGWKAIAVNASDIAAMCGRPLWATIALSVPRHTPITTVDEMVDGILQAAETWNIGVVGGDVSRASEVSLAVTMIGATLGESAVLRSGARTGDELCVTGNLGGAAAGLRLLRDQDSGEHRSVGHPSGQTTGSEDAASGLIRRQLRPTARVEQAAILARLQPTAMIDLSDGFAPDLARLLRASHTGCRVDVEALPLDPGLDAVFGSEREAAVELAMVGGEDFELLFTVHEDAAADAIRAVEESGCPCTWIGTIGDGDSMVGDKPLSAWEELGWDHLRR
jgi:thiamine-monophosphate kinase